MEQQTTYEGNGGPKSVSQATEGMVSKVSRSCLTVTRHQLCREIRISASIDKSTDQRAIYSPKNARIKALKQYSTFG